MTRIDSVPWLPTCWLLLALAVVGCSRPTPESAAPVTAPNPDTDGYESTVAEKIERLRQRVIASPQSAAAWGQLGMTFAAHRVIDEALVCYAQAERLDPANPRWPYLAALRMIDAEPEQVLDALRRADARSGDYWPLKIRLGRQLVEMGRLDEARDSFEQALKMKPGESQALLGLGHVAYLRGDHDASRGYLERALEHRSYQRDVHLLLIRVYTALGMSDRARQAADRARDARKVGISDPVYDEVSAEGVSVEHVVRRARRSIRSGKHAKAISALEATFEVRDSVDARVELGRALVLADREAEALEQWRTANRMVPGIVDADRSLAEMRRERAELRQ